MKWLSSLAVALAFTAAPALSQETAPPDPGEMALQYSKVLAKNLGVLTNYTWQMRVEVSQAGEPIYVDLVQGRHTADGQLQTTPINDDQLIKQRHGVLRGNLQDSRLTKIRQHVANLRQWTLAYIYMSPGNVVDFFNGANKTDSRVYADAVDIAGTDVLRPGDRVLLSVDKATLSPISLTFSSPSGEGESVSARVQFRYLRDNSAFVPGVAQAQIQAEKKKDNIDVRVETFDFLKQL